MTEIKVFLASPSDVREERDLVERVRDRVEKHFRNIRRDVRITVLRWEDVSPGVHPRGAQGKIESEMDPAECDLVIGIFGSRFGDPTIDGHTPTEHEIRKAHTAHAALGKPDIALYFKKNIPAGANKDEAAQHLRIREFEEEFQKHGLTTPYSTPAEFADSVYDLLWKFVIAREPQAIPVVCVCVPNELCENGVTEPIGKVAIIIPESAVGLTDLRYVVRLTVQPYVNITNNVVNDDAASPTKAFGNRLSEARLSAISDDGSRDYEGVLVENSVVEFRGVSVGPNARELIVDGLRVNAAQLNGPGSVFLLVDIIPIAHEKPIFPTSHLVTAGIVKDSLCRFMVDAVPAGGSYYVKPEIDGSTSRASIVIVGRAGWSGAFGNQRRFGEVLRERVRVLVRIRSLDPELQLHASCSAVDALTRQDVGHLIRADSNGWGDERWTEPIDFEFNGAEFRRFSGPHPYFVWEVRPTSSSFKVCLVLSGEPDVLRTTILSIDAQVAPLSTRGTAATGAPMPRFVEDTRGNGMFVCFEPPPT